MHPNELHFAYTRVRLWQTIEPQNVMTTEKEIVTFDQLFFQRVLQLGIFFSKSTSARNIFFKN
jgi:hypothetical protein